ncbi:hypothetical protein OG787_15685 [Streptomyces sp. NBC_00075]|uniref:Uncharacterized protein n=1 Tax=Streptomyces sp. NBC_00093 TaxID=2975649 RepID=A0AAU1ZXC0_9ACTN
MSSDAVTFGIAIPDTWTEYDLSGDSLAPMRAELLRETPDKGGRDRINATFRQLRRILDGARRHGAVYAAGTTQMFEDGLLMAGVMVFSLTPPPGENFSAYALAQQFSAAGKQRKKGTTRTFTTEQLPAVGPVGRLVGVEEGALADGVSYKILVMHTVVPVPDERRALIITCFSPNLPLADQLYDVFDAITATFAFGEEEPPAMAG